MGRASRLLIAFVLAVFFSGLPATEVDEHGPYFPDPPFNHFVRDWYSQHLRAMGEPSLWGWSRNDRDVTAYRFLWLPTWGRPVAVRIEKRRQGIVLHLRQLDGHGGYEPGKIALDRKINLSPEQWNRQAERVARVGFWSLPTHVDHRGSDGEQLVFEGVRNGTYHVVDRWSPGSGPYRGLCRSMLDLTGLDMGQSRWPEPEPLPWGLILIGILGPFLAVTLWMLLLHGARRPKSRLHAGRLLVISHLLGTIWMAASLVAYALLNGILTEALLGEITVTPDFIVGILVGYLVLALLTGMLLAFRTPLVKHTELRDLT